MYRLVFMSLSLFCPVLSSAEMFLCMARRDYATLGHWLVSSQRQWKLQKQGKKASVISQ